MPQPLDLLELNSLRIFSWVTKNFLLFHSWWEKCFDSKILKLNLKFVLFIYKLYHKNLFDYLLKV